MLSTHGRTPEQISLAGVQCQTVSPHPRRDVISAGEQTQLDVGNSRWSAGTVHLRVISIEMRAETVLLDQGDQISRIQDEKDWAKH